MVLICSITSENEATSRVIHEIPGIFILNAGNSLGDITDDACRSGTLILSSAQ
jgi:hypothetical protein